jgi:outer membrane usher protein
LQPRIDWSAPSVPAPSSFLKSVTGTVCVAVAMLVLSCPIVSAATPGDGPDAPGEAVRQRAKDSASGNRELHFNNAPIGIIDVSMAPNGEPWVPKSALLDILVPMLDADRRVLYQLRAIRDQRGAISLRDLAPYGISFAIDRNHLRLTYVPAPAPAAASTKSDARPPAASAPTPPTGRRASVLELGLTSGGKKVGEISVEVTPPSMIRLPKAALIDMLSPLLDGDPTAVAKIEGLAENNGLVLLDDLTAAGFVVKITGKQIDITRGTAATSTAARPSVAAPTGNAPARPAPSKSDPASLGPAGRAIPLVQDGEVLGEVVARSNGDNEIVLPKSVVVDILTPILEKKPEVLAQIVALPATDDQITLGALQKAGVAAKFTGRRIEIAGPEGDEAPVGHARQVSSRLNPTDKTITLNVPLKEGDTKLGEILVRIEPDGTINVPKATLVQLLGPAVDKAVMRQIEKLPEKGGLVTLGTLGGSDFRLAYDPNQMELAFHPAIEQRVRKDLDLAGRSGVTSTNLVKPANVSGYVNITTGGDYDWAQAGLFGYYLDLQSAIRVAGIVVENNFTYEGEVDPQQCPFLAVCVYDHKAGLKRRYSRLVYDLPDQRMRLHVGDVEQQGGTFQRSTDVLGASIEMSPRKLAPGERVRPTGGSTIAIERASDVEILVNGAVTQRLRLSPGNYNLRDLPLTTGANDIELVITDDRGQRRTMSFNTFSEARMLAAGKSEWSVSGGVASYLADGDRQYRDGEYVASAFHRYGLSDTLSFETQAKGDMHIVEGGFGLLAGTRWGAVNAQSAVSSSDTGIGFASAVNWDLINFRGLVGAIGSTRESMRLGAEYRSAQFRSPGEYVVTSTGILYPQTPYWLRLTGSYSVPLGWGVSAGVAARYQFSDPTQTAASPFRIDGDRYGADVSLSGSLGSMLSTSLTAGYSNEITQRAVADLKSEVSPEMRVMLRFFLRPAANTRVSGSYDTLNGASSVSASQSASSGVNRWEADVNAQTDKNAQQTLANGSLAWTGNRGEIRVSQNSSFDSAFGAESAHPATAINRTAVRMGTAVAFADGQVAFGAPVRGNGFAIVHTHDSLSGKPITVGDGNSPRALANGLGPALVGDLPAYVQNTLPVDVADLPAGYSLGAGTFDVMAPYRGGYALRVGSSYSVSVFGILLNENLGPLPLTTGEAKPASGGAQPGKPIIIFTNQAGRFVAEGLGPGKWIIEMATEGTPLRYELDIPEDARGLVQLGRLLPMEG